MFRRIVQKTPQVANFLAGPRSASQFGPIIQIRGFSSFLFLQKKGKKGAKAVEEQPVQVDAKDRIDFDSAKQKLQAVVDRFAKYANDAKLGKTSPKVFDNLMVQTDHGDQPYISLAQTSIKGRNFIMTVYDPANVQRIINSVLGSGLNLNPVVDPSNKLTLKMPLPPITTELKNESVKELKNVYEKLRNGVSLGKNHTLSSIRADVRHKLTKNKKLDNLETEVWNEYEKLHKIYVAKLSEMIKAAETAIMK